MGGLGELARGLCPPEGWRGFWKLGLGLPASEQEFRAHVPSRGTLVPVPGTCVPT